MAIQVKAKGRSGGWFWVKRNNEGQLVWSIYETGALDDSELNACRAEFPSLEFKTEKTLYDKVNPITT